MSESQKKKNREKIVQSAHFRSSFNAIHVFFSL